MRRAACPLAVTALAVAASFATCSAARLRAAEPPAEETSAQRGYRLLTTKVYLPLDFTQATFDDVWRQWPEPLRTQAESASPDERRRMAFSRYGFTTRPDDDSGKPLQYVVEENGNWTMNCFACHGGKVLGQTIPGLPNSHYALSTLTEEIRAAKVRRQEPFARMDFGSLFVPLGSTNGTTNAVMFGVALMAYRDAELNVVNTLAVPRMVHHDMDPPPWWHFKKRKQIYIDGFAQKGHRALMQFMLVKENGPQKFREWEGDFRDVYAYLESIESPKYPFPIDSALATQGEQIFVRSCAECHGTYGKEGTYPGRLVPIEEVETDRVRLDALAPANRAAYGRSWFAHFGEHHTIEDPGGYVAPPLDGIWASGPYFHNGSVPTLWHVLHSDQRPVVWRRTEDGYDRQRIGLEVQTFDDIPAAETDPRTRREYFDTRQFGKSAAGHTFPDALNEGQKRAVLEYLKTL